MLFSPTPAKSLAFYATPFGQRDLISYTFLILYFYFNYFFVIPRLYFTRRFWAFAAVSLACFLLVVWLPGVFIPRSDFRSFRSFDQTRVVMHDKMNTRQTNAGSDSLEEYLDDLAAGDTTSPDAKHNDHRPGDFNGGQANGDHKPRDFHGDHQPGGPGNDRAHNAPPPGGDNDGHSPQGPPTGPQRDGANAPGQMPRHDDAQGSSSHDHPPGAAPGLAPGAAQGQAPFPSQNQMDGGKFNQSPFDHPPHDNAFPFTLPLFGEISHTIFLFLMVLFFSIMIKVINRLKQTEEQRLYAELSNLKAQINPHFLFNALNSIYSLSLEKSDLAPDAIIRLSGMMRYVIYEAGKEWVPMDSEITYVRDYIALQKTRFGHSVDLTFTVTGNAQGRHIAPLVLIPFVENAFKHGVNPEENSIIRIEITIEESQLSLRVFNHKVHVQRYDANGGGIGLDNTRKRLDIIYPGQHTLYIKETPTDYTVLLILSRL